MTKNRGFWASFLYAAIRLSPVAAPAAIVPAPPDDPVLAEILIKQWLALLMVLVTWNMTEGSAILWMNAKRDASEKTRSYLLVTMICGAISIGFLQYLRTLSSQGIFILTLATLCVRGMSRTGWENGRPAAGFAGATTGHSLTALVSFLFLAHTLDWQSALCSLAIGASVGAVEASWHASSITPAATRWALPLFRLSLCLGPVIIATMAMCNQIPSPYIAVVIAVILASKLLKKTGNAGTIPENLILGPAGIYLAFLGIMCACRAYQSGMGPQS
jgi:hypothetical protein